MKVKCIHGRGTRVPDDILALGNTPDTVFNVTLDRLYTVYAMCIWQGVLHHLILNDENHRPDWYPSGLFEVADSRLPSNWHFGFIGGRSGWPLQPIWGYAEMVLDGGEHYLQLVERDQETLEIFSNRQSEIDAEQMEHG
jgi:hypothetical protein